MFACTCFATACTITTLQYIICFPLLHYHIHWSMHETINSQMGKKDKQKAATRARTRWALFGSRIHIQQLWKPTCGLHLMKSIEFFWGVVKKYLRDNCNYTFEALKTNLPDALQRLQSVQLKTFWLWEHRMYHWMDAYQAGLGTSEAQIQVHKFSSTKYKSHWCIPDAVACAFD